VLAAPVRAGTHLTHLLLIEPDPILGRLLRDGLSAQGCRTDWARGVGLEVEVALRSPACEAVVLGFGPAHDARWSALESLLQQGPAPVILVGSREALPEIVRALHAGAEDFLILPFEPQELAVRVRAAVRRAAGRARATIRLGAIELNPVRRIVSLDGEQVPLTVREYILLAVLMAEPGKLVTRVELEQQLYGGRGGSNSIEVHIHNLRRKLGTRFIRTARGRGYWVDSGTG
jgi:two-component system, OmpR family, response regulator QseB